MYNGYTQVICRLEDRLRVFKLIDVPKFKTGDRLRQVKAGNAPHLIGQVIEITRQDNENLFYAGTDGFSRDYLEENFVLEPEVFSPHTHNYSTLGNYTVDMGTTATIASDWIPYPSHLGIDTAKLAETIGVPKTKANKLINKKMNIIKFVKDKALSKEEKVLRRVDFKDSEGNWTNTGIEAVLELEAKALGFKSYEKMKEMYAEQHVDSFKLFELFSKYNDELVKIAFAYEKENK